MPVETQNRPKKRLVCAQRFLKKIPCKIKSLSYVVGIRLSQAFIGTKSMKVMGVKIKKLTHPKCKHYKYDSDFYWQCYVRENTLSMYHPVGTCKMGAADDPTTVVDPQLR